MENKTLVQSSGAAFVADPCKEKHFGTAMGTFGTIFDNGHAAGPILAGLLLASHSHLFSCWIMAAMLLIAIPIFTLTVRTDKDNAVRQ